MVEQLAAIHVICLLTFMEICAHWCTVNHLARIDVLVFCQLRFASSGDALLILGKLKKLKSLRNDMYDNE